MRETREGERDDARTTNAMLDAKMMRMIINTRRNERLNREGIGALRNSRAGLLSVAARNILPSGTGCDGIYVCDAEWGGTLW